MRDKHPNRQVLRGSGVMTEKPKFHSKMIKNGRWTVRVITGNGPESHIGNFATEGEADKWIAANSKDWPRKAGEQK
jgi:hypothetical protein